MSDIEKVVLASKSLEGLLKRNYGAKGKGLHEMTESIKDSLPGDLKKKLHYVATLRNKVIHEEGYDHLDDPKTFDQVTKLLKKELSKKDASGGGMGGLFLKVLIILGLLVAGMAFLMGWIP